MTLTFSAITNSLLACSLLGIGIVAATHSAIMLGRSNTTHINYFKWGHRISGYIFLTLYLFISAVMFKKLGEFNLLPPKAVIHAYIGITIFSLIIIKICIARLFKKFYKSLSICGILVMIGVYLQIPLHAGLYIFPAIWGQNVALSEKGRLVWVNVNIGRQVVQKKCATCHSLERVYAYAKTKEGWQDYVSRMRAKDPAIMSDQEALEALGYLVKNLGIDEMKMDVQVGMRIILEKCHKCHSIDRVFTSMKTRAEWAKTIELIRSFDPLLLNDSEVRQINYYLGKVLAIQETGQDNQKTYQLSRNPDLFIR